MRLQPPIWLPVAAGIVALATAGGGFSDATLGVATAVVWLLLGGLLVGGRIGLGAINRRLAWLLGSFAFLAGWAALSLGWTSDSAAGFADLVRLLLYLGVILTAGLAARPRTGPSWFAGVALGGVLVALLGLGSRLFGLGGDEQIALELAPAAERLSYPIGYWNGLGYLLAMTLPALLWLALGARSSVAALAAAGSTPVVVALFLTSSRGAVVAGVAALLIVGWFATDRQRLILLATVVLPAWTVAVLVAAAVRGELDAIDGPGRWGPLLAVLIVALATAAYLALRSRERGPALRSADRLGGRRIRLAVGALVLVAVVALGTAIGPDALLGEFRSQGSVAEGGTGEGLASGSGRSALWGTALEAFGDDPWRGVGAGGYETYWNANGDLRIPARNAHSEPLEALAELGLPGALALFGAIGLALAGAASRLGGRVEGREPTAAALAMLVAGLMAIGIDWTWELPAALAPFLIALVLLCGRGLEPEGAERGSLLVDSRIAGYEHLPEPPWLPLGAARVGIAAATAVALWAGMVLSVAAFQLERGSDRLERGDLAGAAQAARSAARIEPWSQEPPLLLTEIEQAAANFGAARRRAEQAAELAPADFRPWLLLSQIHLAVGEAGPAAAYATRARELAPRALGRPSADGA